MAFEDAVAKIISGHLADQANRHGVLARADMAASVSVSDDATDLATRIKTVGLTLAAPIITSGEIARGKIRINVDAIALAAALNLKPSSTDPDLLVIDAPFACRRRGVEMKIIAGDPVPSPDAAMVRALKNAHRWAKDLRAGSQLAQIAETQGVSKRYVARILPLAFLSPRLQTAILKGTQPVDLNLEKLVRARLPLGWQDQERMLGDHS